jgi:hypothetical protein
MNFDAHFLAHNAYQGATMLPFITRDRKTLRTRGLRHRKAHVMRFLTVPITQFRIFARKYPFSQSGSQLLRYMAGYDV